MRKRYVECSLIRDGRWGRGLAVRYFCDIQLSSEPPMESDHWLGKAMAVSDASVDAHQVLITLRLFGVSD